jgi:hypothetical protein
LLLHAALPNLGVLNWQPTDMFALAYRVLAHRVFLKLFELLANIEILDISYNKLGFLDLGNNLATLNHCLES